MSVKLRKRSKSRRVYAKRWKTRRGNSKKRKGITRWVRVRRSRRARSRRSTCLSSTMMRPLIIKRRLCRRSHFQWTIRNFMTTSSHRLITRLSPMKSSKSYSCFHYRPESVKFAVPLCATNQAGTNSIPSISASYPIPTRTSSLARRSPTTPPQTIRSAWTPPNFRKVIVVCWERSGPTSLELSSTFSMRVATPRKLRHLTILGSKKVLYSMRPTFSGQRALDV